LKGSGGAESLDRRVILLTGDGALIARRLEEIQAATVGRTPLFGVHEVLHGDNADLEAIATALGTLSLSGKRLVVLRAADRLREESQRGVLDLLDRLPAGTCFVLIAETPDMRRSLFAALAKRGALERLEPESAEQFVGQVARELSLRLEPAAAAAIAEHVGADASRILGELEKLRLRFGQERIDVASALETIGGERTIAEFALSNALRSRDIGRAIGILRQGRLQGERIEMAIGLIASQLRSLLKARAMLEKGLSESAAIAALGGYAARYVVAAARNYTVRELTRTIAGLSEVDLAAKTGGGDAIAKLERLLTSLVRRPGAGSAAQVRSGAAGRA
jgi:DNA polymerase III delta subunit